MSGSKETQQSKYTDEKVRKWALYQHLPWGKNGRNPERSLHRSQLVIVPQSYEESKLIYFRLETSQFDIESLFVCKSDGSHFKNNDPKRKLKLCFTGGEFSVDIRNALEEFQLSLRSRKKMLVFSVRNSLTLIRD